MLSRDSLTHTLGKKMCTIPSCGRSPNPFCYQTILVSQNVVKGRISDNELKFSLNSAAEESKRFLSKEKYRAAEAPNISLENPDGISE